MFRFMNLGVVNYTTYHQLCNMVVSPVIMNEKDARLARNCAESRERARDGVVIAGRYGNSKFIMHKVNRAFCPIHRWYDY